MLGRENRDQRLFGQFVDRKTLVIGEWPVNEGNIECDRRVRFVPLAKVSFIRLPDPPAPAATSQIPAKLIGFQQN
jgi:hypothetical protein